MDNDFGLDAEYDVDMLIDGLGSDYDEDSLTLPDDSLFEDQ